jgi:hypothetical protein
MKIEPKNIQIVIDKDINSYDIKSSVKGIFDDYKEAREYCEKLDLEYYISIENNCEADIKSQHSVVDLESFLDILSNSNISI